MHKAPNMQKQVIAFLVSAFLWSSCWGQQSNILSTVSPKLKEFLGRHPAADKTLIAGLSSAFTNKTARLFYFYRVSEAEARAFHFYPNMNGMPTSSFASTKIKTRWTSSFLFCSKHSIQKVKRVSQC
jgi:hypothetical protein